MLNAEESEQGMESSTLELGEEAIRTLKCYALQARNLFANKYTLFLSLFDCVKLNFSGSI